MSQENKSRNHSINLLLGLKGAYQDSQQNETVAISGAQIHGVVVKVVTAIFSSGL